MLDSPRNLDIVRLYPLHLFGLLIYLLFEISCVVFNAVASRQAIDYFRVYCSRRGSLWLMLLFRFIRLFTRVFLIIQSTFYNFPAFYINASANFQQLYLDALLKPDHLSVQSIEFFIGCLFKGII